MHFFFQITLASPAAQRNEMKLGFEQKLEATKVEMEALKTELEELKNAKTNGETSLTEADVRAIVVDEGVSEARVERLADYRIERAGTASVTYVQNESLASRNYARWMGGQVMEIVREERATSRDSMVVMEGCVGQLAETVAEMEERLSQVEEGLGGVEYYQQEHHGTFLEQHREVQNLQLQQQNQQGQLQEVARWVEERTTRQEFRDFSQCVRGFHLAVSRQVGELRNRLDWANVPKLPRGGGGGGGGGARGGSARGGGR